MIYRIITFLTGLPRIIRIFIAGVFALAVTTSLSPVVDEIYLRYLFTPETTLIPSLVSGGLGLAMYVVGWWLYIGSVQEKPHAQNAILWYFVMGLSAVLIVFIWIFTGFRAGNISTTSAFFV